MHTSTILYSTLLSLAAALPTSQNLDARAGGPAAKPIPSTCTVTSPLPTNESGATFKPGPSTDDSLFYYAYFPSPSSNTTQMQQQCLEQCYGYGDSTQCKTAYWAENAVVPAGYYGSPGGNLETGCLFFNRTLEQSDFVEADQGKYTSMFAGNIQCPA